MKVFSVGHFLMFLGSLFHRVAAAFLKHMLPYVIPRVLGIVSSVLDSDLRDLVG